MASNAFQPRRGCACSHMINPIRQIGIVALVLFVLVAQLLRSWGAQVHITQGSSCLATLGFVAESLWDSPSAETVAKDPCKLQPGTGALRRRPH